VAVTILAADVMACPRFAASSRVRIGACGGLRLGGFAARGRGFSQDENALAVLADLRVAPRLEVTLTGPLYAFLAPALVIPTTRQQVRFREAGSSVSVYDRPPLGLDGALGFGLRLAP